MLGQEELKVEEIAQGMNLERSTVQKAIKNLTQKNIVLRKQENLDKGGYVFRYEIKDKNQLKVMIVESVDQWHKNVLEEIKKW